MEETKNNDRIPVYEISYLIAPSIVEEKLEGEVSALKGYLAEAGEAVVIAEEMPHREHLAYTMRKKTVSGSYEKCDEAYFGWVKFEAAADKVEAVKKLFEKHPSVLRMLLISTVRENTYLGKHASAIAASFSAKTEVSESRPAAVVKIETPTAPASKEEMDKSIDAMVGEAV